jgi:hypothetical protein
MEETEIDKDCFMSFCLKFKYLRIFLAPEVNDTMDIIERISQARELFNSMNQQLTPQNPAQHRGVAKSQGI